METCEQVSLEASLSMTHTLPTHLDLSREVEDEGLVCLLLPWCCVGTRADGAMDPEVPPQPQPLLHSLFILLCSVSLAWAVTQPPRRFGLGDEDFSQLLSYSVGSAVAIARW